jgi:pimeloyl-ACP methyl ester carboxylesterase
MRASRWRLPLVGAALVLAGCVLASAIQTAGGIKVRDVRFIGGSGAPMSALLYVPPNASPATPAPGVLAVHGYFNSREVQDGFAIEFARRGYVVLALDQTGHGYSASPTFRNGYGGPDGLKFLRSLDIVDKANIGLEGHSMGGWAVDDAAASDPDGYKATVLEGSSTGRPYAPDGTPAFPRNLAVVYSQYDEFSQIMWNVAAPKAVVSSPKLEAVFGTTSPVIPGQVYGDIAAGTARVLYTPPITHAQDHISREAIGDALDWFQHTLTGGARRADSDQIWPWKEAGTLVALIGFIVLLLGAFDVLLELPWFSSLVAEPAPARNKRDPAWWLALAAITIIPAATFLPVMLLAGIVAPASHVLPEAYANGIALWALLNGLIGLAVGVLSRGKGAGFNLQLLPSVGVALLTVAVGYASLSIADALFKVDFRIWFVGLKLLNRERFGDALVYLVPFTLYAVLALRGLLSATPVAGERPLTAYLVNIGALTGGFGVFLVAEYWPMFAGDQLLTPGAGLFTIMAVQFVPVMAAIGLIATFTYRRTNSYLPGAFICGLLVTWYIVAGQAIQAG